MTVAGPTLVVDVPVHVAVTGADLGLATSLGPLRPDHAVRLPAGTTIRSGTRRRGARAYLAFEGGLDVPAVLGSPSTDRRSRLGGIGGRELRAGDALRLGTGGSEPLRSVAGRAASPGGAGAGADEPIRIVATPPSLDWFDASALDALVDTAWTVADDADRHGLRLLGGRIPASTTGIASVGVPLGAIQVPASGEPIVTMVDGPVTGGYPVVGVVAGADHGRLAQLVPGDRVRFALVSVLEARALAIEEPDVEVDPGDLAAGWAGSSG